MNVLELFSQKRKWFFLGLANMWLQIKYKCLKTQILFQPWTPNIVDVIVHVLLAANKRLGLCKHCWHFLCIRTAQHYLARCEKTSVWLGELWAFRALYTCWLRQILPLARQHAVVLETRRKPVWCCMDGWWRKTAENISILVCKMKAH